MSEATVVALLVTVWPLESVPGAWTLEIEELQKNQQNAIAMARGQERFRWKEHTGYKARMLIFFSCTELASKVASPKHSVAVKITCRDRKSPPGRELLSE